MADVWIAEEAGPCGAVYHQWRCRTCRDTGNWTRDRNHAVADGDAHECEPTIELTNG